MSKTISWRACANNNSLTCLRDDHCIGVDCARRVIEHDELLTVDEKEVLIQLGILYRRMHDIIGGSHVGHSDREEMVHYIHILQRMIMSQAAARRYPELLRSLGG